MITTAKLISLEEYLNYDDGTENLYELVNGELVLIPPESDRNQHIAISLIAHFLQLGLSPRLLRNQIAIVVTGGRATARIPDLTILSEALALQLLETTKAIVLPDMPPPQLVVEVVSPQQDKRDYRYKRSEYAARQIPEYWIVDPIAHKVTILELVEGFYEEQIYVGTQFIQSPSFVQISLTAEQILTGF